MGEVHNLFGRNKTPTIENKPTTLSPEVTLKSVNAAVKGIACVLPHELIAVVTTRYEVHVCGYTNQGEPSHVFREHKGPVNGLVHVCEDVLASVDSTGMLVTWRATTGVRLNQLKVSENGCSCMERASATGILVGTQDGEIVIVEHSNGKKLRVQKRCRSGESKKIRDISVCNGIFVVAVRGNVQVWSCLTGEILHSIESENRDISNVAISDDFIVIGNTRGNIHIHGIRAGYDLLRTIKLNEFRFSTIASICFLNIEIVMATTENAIFLVSVKSGQCISRSQIGIGNSRIVTGTSVLSDGRVCVSGNDGRCSIFKLPQEVEDYAVEYNQRMHASQLAHAPFFSPPLKYIFRAVQEKSVAPTDASDFVVCSKFHSKSIQEWACAHLIVMAAVKSGHVPGAPKYKGEDIFWWNHLYKVASSIEMGQRDRRLVLKFIIEAEEVGILGAGCAEMFQETNEIRSELNMLSSTIVDLYTRQIAMDKQVQGILHYQKIQPAMSFVNAILTCIPLAGNVAVHVLSGGMAILENVDGESFAISGMVESLLGVGKDWSSFITEPVVKRFLRAGDVILQEGTWNEIPESNRCAVEAAAAAFGLSIDGLRRRLRAADLEEPPAPCDIIVEEVEEEENTRLAGGNEGTDVVNAKGECLQNISTAGNGIQEKTEGGPSATGEAKNRGRDNSDASKAIENLRLCNKELEDKMAKIELRNRELEKTVAETDVLRLFLRATFTLVLVFFYLLATFD